MTAIETLTRARSTYANDGASAVLQRGFHYGLAKTGERVGLLDEVCFDRSVRRLRHIQADEEDTEDVVRTPYRFSGVGPYRSIAPNQIFEEILTFSRLLEKYDPDTVVEIGTASGGTLYIWSRLTGSNGHVVSIDYSLSERQQRFFGEFARCTVDCVVGDSQSESSRQQVERSIDDAPIDFLFVDGDGAYESVKADFEQYQPLLASDAVVAFHDIDRSPEEGHGVQRYWEELKSSYEHEEVSASPDHRAGIGVLYL